MKPIYTFLFMLFTIVAVAQPTASQSDHVYALEVSAGSCQSPVSSSSSSDISANLITSSLGVSCVSGGGASYYAIWLSVVAPDSGKLSFVTGRSSTYAFNIYTTLYSKNQNDEYTEVLCQHNDISTVTASNLSPGETYYLQLVDFDDYRYDSKEIEKGFYACAFDPDGTLDLPQTQKPLLSYYSNPVGNRLSVESPYQIQTLRVFDLMGKEVLRKTPNQQKLMLNTYTLAPGAYLLRVETAEGQQTVKLIKK